MKIAKVKISRSKDASKKGKVALFTVNVARMERYLDQSRDTFKDRVKQTKTAQPEFVGTLAGPVARAHATK